jgi:glycerophosphoryl diester phosphodiesterase
MRDSRIVRYGAGQLPLAIAHRGGGGLAPENTLAAFSLSHALGVRYFETDVRLTRDGVPVLFHDADLRRILRQPGSIDQVRHRDLPSWVPTLEAALDRFPNSCFTIDIKDAASISAIADVLHRSGGAGRVCIAGAWDGTLHRLAKSVGPDLNVAMGWRALCGLVTSSHSRLPLTRRGRPAFVHVPLRVGRLPIFADRLLRRAHALDVRVIVWTVNDPETMTELLDAGADGIITDRPDLLREVLIGRGQWMPIGARPMDHQAG